jgi:LuxR family transcriptional regulator, maltose regulon positive regulatory protein
VSSPQFKIQPPRRVELAIERPRLSDALSMAADANRLILVEAPAGYGKSTILREWAGKVSLPFAWLTLDRFDAQPERLYRGVVAALQSAAVAASPAMNDALVAQDPALIKDEAAAYDHLLGALELLEDPLAVVIDDVHLAGPGLVDGVVGVLLSSAPPTLKLVLSGRDHSSLRLERLRYGGGLEELQAADLAFTLQEATQFAVAIGQASERNIEAVWRATAGWPVAVHASFLGMFQTAQGPQGASVVFPHKWSFTDYIAEEVLGQLSPALADFVLRATTSDWLDRELALELSGVETGGILLQECLRKGLFIEQSEAGQNEAVYHWQPLFASQCREILAIRNPALAQHLHRVAARYYQDLDVSESVGQALLGHEPQLAVTSLVAHWLEYLLRNGLYPLEQVCAELPAPWRDDAAALMIRAICRALAGDSTVAAELTGRALGGESAQDRLGLRPLEVYLDLLGTLPKPNFSQEGGRARIAPEFGSGVPSPASLPVAGVVGREDVSVIEPIQAPSQDDDIEVFLLPAAANTAGHNPPVLEGPLISASEIALAFAAAGNLVAAHKQGAYTLDTAEELGVDGEKTMASLWLAGGITYYWTDDLAAARALLDKTAFPGSPGSSVNMLGAFYRAVLDCADGDPIRIAATRSILTSLPDQRLYGSSWNAFFTIAGAKLAEAAGNISEALAIVKPLGVGGHPPLVDTFLAELLRRGGKLADALLCTRSVTEDQRNSYTGTSLALTEALLANSSGDKALAHERIEQAISLAEPQGVLRPFTEHGDELAELLTEHAVWGTAHEAFVAARMTRYTHADNTTTFLYWSLTERELEVLAYMRSMMTASDIGKALYISVNTVKTHQRSIYRKLGAASRRDVLKIAAARGIL